VRRLERADDWNTDAETSIYDAEVEARPARADRGPRALGFVPGGEEDFLVFCARERAAAIRSSRLNLVAAVAIIGLLGLVGWQSWSQRNQEPWVLVKDSLGNVIQADPKSFLYAGAARTEEEIKAFVREWVVDCFTWTPLDVRDRLKACLSRIDGKAQGAAKSGLRLAERRQHVEDGVSGGIHRDGTQAVQTVIVRREPLELLVSVERYLVDRAGVTTDGGPLFVRAIVRQVPRSPANGYGLMVVSAQVSEKL
jgi:hypothetical protein